MKKTDSKPENYATQKGITDKLSKTYDQIVNGFKEEKQNQSEGINEYWDIYNCELNDNQQYSGEAEVYEPIVRDALEARRKRFTGMLFPNVGNNIEVISEQGDTPQATLSLLQRHVVKTNLRGIVPSIFLNGDVEGQWSLMVDWKKTERTITKKVKKPIEGTTEDAYDIEEETIYDEGPDVTILAAQDLWVFPSIVSNIQDAEIVCVALRLTDDAIKEKVKEGLFLKKSVDKLQKDSGEDKTKWAAKARSSDAGVKMKAGQKFTLIFQVYMELELNDKKVPAIAFLGGPNNVLGVIKNPYWSQKVNIISEPVDKVSGSFWGKSKIQPVAALQYQLNDISNMGMDSAQYSVLPIVLTDPVKNPRVGSMVMAMAAIWETSPNDTKIVEFPPLYQHALTMRSAIKQQIMESLDVNETMLGKAPAGRKNAQAIGQQSAEAMATIGDVVKRFENGVMNVLLEWFYELDLQYRENDLMVIRDGEHGMQAIIEAIPPQQVTNRYWFKWLGADQAMGSQRVQTMIGIMNVLRGIPPQQLNGRKLDIGPLLDFIVEAACGPTLSQNVLIDERHKISLPPDIENEILLNGLPVDVNPLDNDVEHIKSHQEAAQATGDAAGIFRKHIMDHVMAIQKKNPQPQGQPGIPGGVPSGGQPGVAGTPRPGAIPAPQRPVQAPPGAIHQDQMQDPQAGMRG